MYCLSFELSNYSVIYSYVETIGEWHRFSVDYRLLFREPSGPYYLCLWYRRYRPSVRSGSLSDCCQFTWTFIPLLAVPEQRWSMTHNLKKFRFTLNKRWLFAFIGYLGCLGAFQLPCWSRELSVITTGLTVAGKMLPSYRFAMIMSMMAERVDSLCLGRICLCLSKHPNN